MAAHEDPDRIAEIAVKLSKVQQAHRDNEVDVFNPSHHASWDDIEWLHAIACRLTQEVAALRQERDTYKALWDKETAQLDAQIVASTEAINQLKSEDERLRVALDKIADPERPLDICGCDHSDDGCCVLVDYYCPICIAATALKPVEVRAR